MQDQEIYARTRSPGGSTATAVAETAKETGKQEAGRVVQTAKREAGTVVEETRSQIRRLAGEARDKAGAQVHGQHDRMVQRLRAWADEFEEMAGDRGTPARAVVGDLAERGRRVADYMGDRGPEGIVTEVQDFARRRPMAFIAGAVAAGFLVGRLGKGVWKARSAEDGAAAGTGSTPNGAVGTGSMPPGSPPASVVAEPVVAPMETMPPVTVVPPTTPETYRPETYRAGGSP